MKKIKYCKCGHNKKNHTHDNLFALRECSKCNCTEFMNRKRPTILSKGFLVLGMIVISFLLLASVMIFSVYISTPSEQMNKQTITLGKYLELAVVAIAAIFVLESIYVYRGLIKSYFEEKHRKEYPIDDSTDQNKTA